MTVESLMSYCLAPEDELYCKNRFHHVTHVTNISGFSNALVTCFHRNISRFPHLLSMFALSLKLLGVTV